ncbi:MAG: Fe-S cluster assembly protein SufD [Albidovulum sp.]|nr:Fe-S cluster assembly protein SufD [Albidovulum sp.]MDE0303732.1 Fe-S cluster assembly protein SufD [Albidovulum sp.]MDE0532320.1 Fe-S cluster assembly protein SufD [Albidovulum sp.]
MKPVGSVADSSGKTVESSWAQDARNDAGRRLDSTGLPKRRDEYWKFTRPDALIEPVGEVDILGKETSSVFQGIDRLKVKCVDGEFNLSGTGQPNLQLQLLKEALGDEYHWAEKVFGELESDGQKRVPRPFASMNTLRATEGLALRASGYVANPVAVTYNRESLCSDTFVRHVIRVESGAELTFLEAGPVAARFNKVIEVEVEDGGLFRHVCIQGRDHGRLHVSHVFAKLGAESSLKSFTLTANGKLMRNEFVVNLAGNYGRAHLSGAAIGDGEFHHDDTVFVEHSGVHCESRQVFKKVLRNGAKGVFQGKILVNPGAQKTDGYQISQALLLDGASQFLAKPELEIYADDVACSHGSTCGAIDEDALFYLRSRGIPLSDAKDMLILSFLADVFDEIDDERLAAGIVDLLRDWLSRHR